jgi:hypothetical protein
MEKRALAGKPEKEIPISHYLRLAFSGIEVDQIEERLSRMKAFRERRGA